MSINHRLLIVAPDAKVTPSDIELRNLLYSLLDIKEPTTLVDKAVKAVMETVNVVESSKKVGYAFQALARQLTRNSKPSLDAVKYLYSLNKFVSESAFLYLLKQLYQTDLPRILPGAIVVAPDDTRLENLKCSDGGFVPNVVYAKHPADSSYYLPIANFHAKLESEKRAEMFALFDALGAKDYAFISSTEQAKQLNIRAGLEEPSNLTDVGVDLRSKYLSNDAYTLRSTSEKPAKPPTLPDHLRWFYQEEEWKRLAEARLNNLNKKTYFVTYTYKEDFGITTELNATMSGLGLSAGGTFSKMQETSLIYIVEFFTSKDYKEENFNFDDIEQSLASAKKRIFVHL